MKQACHKGCYHCPGGPALKHRLFDDEYFWITCDCHPLAKGHILIISKEHISCMGALSNDSFGRFKELYAKVLNFLNKTNGPAAVFEHGVLGQTVPHAHVHFLPFSKPINAVVPEKAAVKKISTLDEMTSSPP